MSAETRALTIEGPGKNALGSALMQRMIDEIRRAGGRPLLLAGAGDAFSAGLDLKEVATLDRPGMERYLGLLDDLVDALYGYSGPTVACVNGHAIAGGCMLVLCCDLRVAADDPALRIGLNEVPLGLEFPPKLLRLVRRRVSRRSLDQVVLDGALHDAPAALRLGLVDEIAADAATVARSRLARLAAHPAAVYAATKRVLREGHLDLSAEERQHFREHVVPAWCAPEVKERVRAALRPRR
jgi:enoyl-CoA hydratase